jgi:hypothetical protein
MVTFWVTTMGEFIQTALYQRAPERRDQRNGHCKCDLVTTMGEIEELEVSQGRRIRAVENASLKAHHRYVFTDGFTTWKAVTPVQHAQSIQGPCPAHFPTTCLDLSIDLLDQGALLAHASHYPKMVYSLSFIGQFAPRAPGLLEISQNASP